MMNMAYCRFENTLAALRECWENWNDAESDEEIRARRLLRKLCAEIAEALEYLDDED